MSYFRGRLWVTSQFSVEPTVSFNWVHLPQASFTSTLVATRASFTMNPRMFVAALLQYNSGGETLRTNVRLRWEHQPGSELFVVYSDERATSLGGPPTVENRAFVVKVNRLFRF